MGTPLFLFDTLVRAGISLGFLIIGYGLTHGWL